MRVAGDSPEFALDKGVDMKWQARKVIAWAAALALLLGLRADTRACDTWVALRDVTQCGYTILAKNSDRPRFDCQPLIFHPRKKWPDGSRINLGRVTISQVEETYANMGSSPYWCWGYEEGINEYGVAIGNEGIRTKVLIQDRASYEAGKGPKLGPTGMDLLRLGLERGRTARESLEAIAGLVEQYGQFGSGAPTRGVEGAYHNSYIIADSKEAWVLETAGTHWVARRLPKGSTSISNEVSLGRDYELASRGLVEYAVSREWWPEDEIGQFHFKAAYSASNSPGGHPRAMRSCDLLQEKGGQIDVRWMMRIARDRGSSPSIDQGGTASSCVAVLPDAEDQLPVFWWCPAVPSNSCYVPFFIHGSGLPEMISTAGTYGRRIEAPSKVDKDGFSPQSYWWLFRDLSDRVEADRKHRNSIVRGAFDTIEREFEAGIPDVVKRAVELRTAGRDAEAASVLDDYSAGCLKKVLVKLAELRSTFQ